MTTLSAHPHLPWNVCKVVERSLLLTLEKDGMAVRLGEGDVVSGTSALQQHLRLVDAWKVMSGALSSQSHVKKKAWFHDNEKHYVVLAAQIEGCKVIATDAPEKLKALSELLGPAEATLQAVTAASEELCSKLVETAVLAMEAIGEGGPDKASWKAGFEKSPRPAWTDIMKAASGILDPDCAAALKKAFSTVNEEMG